MPLAVKIKDINDADVEIPIEVIVAYAKDYTDGFKEGFSRAYAKSFTRSSLITYAAVMVTALGALAITETVKNHKKQKPAPADSE